MWECRQCTFHNSDASHECEVCHGRKDDPEGWQCATCTMFTPNNRQRCTTCERPRRTGDRANKQVSHTVELPSKKVTDLGRNDTEERELVSETSVHAQETNWVCVKNGCNTPNSDVSYRCAACNAVKPYLPFLQRSEVKSAVLEEEAAGKVKLTWTKTSADDAHYTRTTTHREPVGSHDSLPQDLNCFHLDGVSWQPAGEDSMQQPPEDLAAGIDEEVLEFPDSECRIMLVGKTGHGKSSTANTILGLNKFETSCGFQSNTKHCQRFNRRRFGIHIEVADTPGLFDTYDSDHAVMEEIAKCLGIMSPGPHAIIIVVRIGIRFTEEEVKAVEQLRSMFGIQLLRHLVIVFTFGDTLSSGDGVGGSGGDRDGDEVAAVRGMIDTSPDALQQLVREANNRYVVFNNKADVNTKNRQVKRLLVMICDLLKVNGGRPYTSRMLDQVEVCMLQRESEVIRDLHGHCALRDERIARHKQQARDIIRDQLVAPDNPLLVKILQQIEPFLRPVLKLLIQMLCQRVVSAAASSGCCIL